MQVPDRWRFDRLVLVLHSIRCTKCQCSTSSLHAIPWAMSLDTSGVGGTSKRLMDVTCRDRLYAEVLFLENK